MAENQFVRVTVEDKVATVVIDNPPANALSSAVLDELRAAYDQISSAGVKVAILTGSGMMFAAGADIGEIKAIDSGARGAELAWAGSEFFKKIEDGDIAFIAAINGMCLGGGTELVMSCHIRVASDRAQLGQPEINLGIIPGFGGTQRLPRLVGKGRALDMILTGERIRAPEAKAIGLVDRVVPDAELMKQAKGLAQRIASKPGVALKLSLKAVREGVEMSLADGLKFENELFGQVCDTHDMKEGVSAFLEKRQPDFQDS